MSEQGVLADEAAPESATSPPSAAASSTETAYRGAGPSARKGRPQPTLWERATYRWIAISLVMAVLFLWYELHPLYKRNDYQDFRNAYPFAFGAWLVFGLFYARATVKKFSAMRYMMRDSGLHFLLLGKRLLEKRFWKTAKNPRIRTTLLALCVKAFFIPLMCGFVHNHAAGITRLWLQHKHLRPFAMSPLDSFAGWWNELTARLPELLPVGSDLSSIVTPWTWSRQDFSWGLSIVYDCIFFVDVTWALVGYASESRWLGNKTRSVESTAFGWTVALACYPPFNNVLGTYLPLDSGTHLGLSDDILLGLRAATVLLFAIYAAATVAFGFKFSNLTNRGIVSRGPYRYVRHPAYATKCTAWWLEHLPTMTFSKAIFLTGLCGVYALRAWTEERHLSHDPDYRAYKAKVRWVIFPGVY